MARLVGIVGSDYSKSTNRKLLEYMQSQFFFKIDIDLVEIADLPMFDLHEAASLPDKVKAIVDKINAADGVIIATPEYDHLPPAVLLNALSWLSYKVHPLAGKPVLIVGASYGVLATSRAQGFLRDMLAAPELDAQVFPRGFMLGYSLQAFDDWGDLRGREKIQEMEDIFEEFLKFVEAVNASIDKDLISIHEFDNFKWDKLDDQEEVEE